MHKHGLFSSMIKDACRVGVLMKPHGGGVKGAWLTSLPSEPLDGSRLVVLGG